MKNKINERSGPWMDLRVNNPENPFCFWNSVRASSFLDKRGKSQVLFFRKSPLRKNRFPYRVCLWGCQGPSSGSVCQGVGETEAGRWLRKGLVGAGQQGNRLEWAKSRWAAGDKSRWILSESEAPTHNTVLLPLCVTRPPQHKMASQLCFATLEWI